MDQHFDEFLSRISLGQKQVDRIESAWLTLKGYLIDEYDLSEADIFVQGSYANGTAVRPVEGGEYDVDIICICAPRSVTAKDAIDDLYASLESHGRYKGKLTSKQPCVRIQYADDEIGSFHVDVVPVRPSDDDVAPLDAPRKSTGWHPTAPSEYTSWCQTQGPLFRQTVQMLKRWRDEHQKVRGAVKSIVLQVLVSQSMPVASGSTGERIARTLENMNNALAGLCWPPEVSNPVLKKENLAERWPQQAFENFQSELREATELAQAALDADDDVEAAENWRNLFGDAFPAIEKNQAKGIYSVALADTSHALTPGAKNWTVALDPRYSINIRAWEQLGKNGRRIPYESDTRLLFPNKWINFKANIVAPTECSVWWQVTNTGKHARDRSGLRGEFFKAKARGSAGKPSKDEADNWEATSYTGTHVVQAFLLVGTRVVAQSDRFFVNIFNKAQFWQR
ncbi:nucleotide-binding domain-containing protein [Rhodococcoides fascians]|uniref:nucleotide-binding domain-containing protein n=1 Tax=Rhodococcoides fascians TaxID=1828 RepID=UPI0009B809C5|nr:nucleotidyltransferase [Rhodococcus fascians]